MIKKIFNIVFLICIYFNLTFFNIFAENLDNQSLDISAKSAILIEETTGKVLYELNQDEKLSPASVTKVMTLYLIYEAIENEKISWEDDVSEYAASMGGSQIFLEPNEKQTVRELTKSVAIASANDAAVALAEFIAGSEKDFVLLMNKKAKELGMNNTNFENACGLDTDTVNHYMSARDISIISRELMNKYPEVKEFTTTWQDTITHTTKKGDTQFGLTNTNKLLKLYDGATGLKTGSTGKALYCLSGSAERDGLKLIAVVMAAPDPKARFQDVMKMLDYGFANYETVSCEEAGKTVGSVNVYKGKKENVDAIVEKTVNVITRKGEKKEIKKEINLIDNVKAPINKETKLGEVIYYYEDEEIGRTNLVSKETIEKASLSDIFKKLIVKWFS